MGKQRMTTLDELAKLLAEHERLHDDIANHAEGSPNAVEAAWRAHDARIELQSALLANSPELLASARRAERLEKLVRDMIENEPDQLVADGGHTVFDEWCYYARAALKEKTP